MTDTLPERRVHLSETAPRQLAAMSELERSIELDRGLRQLVKLRVSQINGCAFCIDMHWKDARSQGESEERLYLLDAWRDTQLYTERERAALALCEAMTRIADERVSDAVWDDARAVFEPFELSQLVFAITAINAWNRLMVAS